MSTINASNFGDGTNSVPASAVLEGTAKAWARWNGTAATVTESSNVSSLTDNGVGHYTLNLSNAFSTATYVRTGSWGTGTRFVTSTGWRPVAVAATSFEVSTTANTATSDSYDDGSDINATAHGDLA